MGFTLSLGRLSLQMWLPKSPPLAVLHSALSIKTWSLFSLPWIWGGRVTCSDSRIWQKMPGGFCFALGTQSHQVASLSPLLERPHQSPDIAGTPAVVPVLSEAILDVPDPAKLPAECSHRSGHSQHHVVKCLDRSRQLTGRWEGIIVVLNHQPLSLHSNKWAQLKVFDISFSISKLSLRYLKVVLKQANSIIFSYLKSKKHHSVQMAVWAGWMKNASQTTGKTWRIRLREQNHLATAIRHKI